MLDVALTPRNIASRSGGHVAVIIDVFRASTTICTALHAGVAAVIPVRTVEEARARAGGRVDVILGGERGGLAPVGFHAGNSPFEYAPERVAGKTVVFTTTNGTAALLSAPADAVRIFGCFANASAVVEFLSRRRPEHVTLVCAGNNGAFSYEDALCAGIFAARCAGMWKITDEAAAAAAMYAAMPSPDLLRRTDHAKKLVALGFARDVEYCLTSDAAPVIPSFDNGLITTQS